MKRGPEQQQQQQERPSKSVRKARAAQAQSPGMRMVDFTHDPGNIYSNMQAGSTPCDKIYQTSSTFGLLQEQGRAVMVVRAAAATLLEDLPPDVLRQVMPDLQALGAWVAGGSMPACARAQGCKHACIARMGACVHAHAHKHCSSLPCLKPCECACNWVCTDA